jgi:hypothetical protein
MAADPINESLQDYCILATLLCKGSGSISVRWYEIPHAHHVMERWNAILQMSGDVWGPETGRILPKWNIADFPSHIR